MSSYLSVAKGEGPRAEFGGAVVAGKEIIGDGAGELIVHGGGTMLVRLELKKGFDQDGHSHPDHESIGYILSGRIRMTVGDSGEMILTPGSTWYHPKNTHHTCMALEDSEVLEFHAPLREDVLGLFGRA